MKRCCCKQDLTGTAAILRSVSESSRLVIICMIKDGERCVCEIQEALNSPHNLVLHHLNTLKKLGLLRSRKEKKYTYYSLNMPVWNKFVTELNHLFKTGRRVAKRIEATDKMKGRSNVAKTC